MSTAPPLRDEPGIGPIAAATLVCEVGDSFRFDRESKFARWSGTGAIALSSGEGSAEPVKYRLDFRGQQRPLHRLGDTGPRSLRRARRKAPEGKTRGGARRAHKRHLANRVIRQVW